MSEAVSGNHEEGPHVIVQDNGGGATYDQADYYHKAAEEAASETASARGMEEADDDRTEVESVAAPLDPTKAHLNFFPFFKEEAIREMVTEKTAKWALIEVVRPINQWMFSKYRQISYFLRECGSQNKEKFCQDAKWQYFRNFKTYRGMLASECKERNRLFGFLHGPHLKLHELLTIYWKDVQDHVFQAESFEELQATLKFKFEIIDKDAKTCYDVLTSEADLEDVFDKCFESLEFCIRTMVSDKYAFGQELSDETDTSLEKLGSIELTELDAKTLELANKFFHEIVPMTRLLQALFPVYRPGLARFLKYFTPNFVYVSSEFRKRYGDLRKKRKPFAGKGQRQGGNRKSSEEAVDALSPAFQGPGKRHKKRQGNLQELPAVVPQQVGPAVGGGAQGGHQPKHNESRRKSGSKSRRQSQSAGEMPIEPVPANMIPVMNHPPRHHGRNPFIPPQMPQLPLYFVPKGDGTYLPMYNPPMLPQAYFQPQHEGHGHQTHQGNHHGQQQLPQQHPSPHHQVPQQQQAPPQQHTNSNQTVHSKKPSKPRDYARGEHKDAVPKQHKDRRPEWLIKSLTVWQLSDVKAELEIREKKLQSLKEFYERLLNAKRKGNDYEKQVANARRSIDLGDQNMKALKQRIADLEAAEKNKTLKDILPKTEKRPQRTEASEANSRFHGLPREDAK